MKARRLAPPLAEVDPWGVPAGGLTARDPVLPTGDRWAGGT